MKFTINIVQLVSHKLRAISVYHSTIVHCRNTFRGITTAFPLHQKSQLAAQPVTEPAKFSRKLRFQSLQRIRNLAMSDPALAAQLQPLQALVKEQVSNFQIFVDIHDFQFVIFPCTSN